MTDKELRRLSRAELLEMLLRQSKNAEKLAARLERAGELLEERKVTLEQAGSIAEAALQLNCVFEAAQDAARQYLESVEALEPAKKQALLMEQREAEHRKKMQEMTEEAQRQCCELRAFTVEQCQKEIAAAKEQVQREWKLIPDRLEEFGRANEPYRELITVFLKEEYGKLCIADAQGAEADCRSEDNYGEKEEQKASCE